MIRYIKDDGNYFYIVTDKGQKCWGVKNRAVLVNTTATTWTIKRDNYVITYDENGNYVDQHFA